MPHAFEIAGAALGPDGLVIGASERRTFMEPRAHRERRVPIERWAGQRVGHEQPDMAAVIDYVHDVIVLLDASGHILFVNRSFSLVTGLDPATRVGQTAESLVHPRDRPRVLADLRAVTSAAGGTRTLLFRVEHADRHWVSVEARAVNCLHDPSIRCIVLTMRDRTEELEVVEQLEASGARM